MAGEIGRDLKVRLIIDTGEAESKLPRVIGQFTELNSVLELGKKAFGLAMEGWEALVATIERGQQFSELSNAFSNLYGATSQFASGLDPLRQALQGTVADVDLMRIANQAALADLSPDSFLEVAKAAEKLGDAAGVNATDALQQLSQGLALGQERALKFFGVAVDSAKAEEAFAKTLGTTADKLSELGKKEAFRVEALKQIAEKSKSVKDANETAGDVLEKLQKVVQNVNDQFANFVNNNDVVVGAFKRIETAVNTLKTALEFSIGQAPALDAISAIDKIKGQADRLMQSGSFLSDEAKSAATDKMAAGIGDLFRSLVQATGAEKAFQNVVDQGNQKAPEKLKWLKSESEERNKLSDEIDKQRDGLRKLDAEMRENSLSKSIESAIDSLDRASFDSLLGNYRDSIYNNTLEGLRQSFKDLPEDELAQRALIITDEKIQEATKALEEKSIEAFRNSVDFFQDVFQNAIDGTTFNLADALKRVAVGFASQMAASIAGSLGINVSGIGSAGGLGQSIAATLGFGGGGQAGVGSIFGSVFGSGAGGMSGVGPVADGGQYGAMIGGGSQIGFNWGQLGMGPQAGILAGAAATAYGAYDFYNSFSNGGKPSLTSQALLAPMTGGLSFAASLFGDGGNPERLQREEMINKLIEQMGGNNRFGLDASAYNINSSDKGAVAAGGLTSPLALILSGGSGKMKDDLTGIFANAVKEGDNFNQTLIRTQSLMSDLGINAEEAKAQLTDLFLDGKVSLSEFSAGIENLNTLAQDNLVGQGSVADAVSIINDKLSTPREKIHAIGLAFTEMAEIGVDSSAEISDYLTANFGPDVAAVFNQITQSGIDTFQEIASATPDQIALIAQALKDLGVEIKDSLESGSADGARAFEDNSDRILNKLAQIKEATNKTVDGLKRVTITSSRMSSNQSLNTNGY